MAQKTTLSPAGMPRRKYEPFPSRAPTPPSEGAGGTNRPQQMFRFEWNWDKFN